MKAIVYDHYGPPDVLHIEEVAKPEPKEDEVLVKVHAVAVTRADCATRDANRKGGALVTVISRLVSGVRRPRQPILGSEFAGVVEATGERVFGSTGFRFGAYAEYLSVKQSSRVSTMPRNVSFEQAAAVTDGGLNALWCLQWTNPREGQKVLVYGASGAIGTAAVQVAKHFKAEVTAVCSTKNLGLMKALGADSVIDYTREDFTQNGRTYDVIMDAVGKHSFRRARRALNPDGYYVATDGLDNLLLSVWDKRVIFKIPPRYTRQDVVLLKELVEAGEFKPVVDRCYAMKDFVEATRYVETEQKTGNVILTIVPG
jgi:NADPH:quinone reductase-like Zn-dependent oxidoreductase